MGLNGYGSGVIISDIYIVYMYIVHPCAMHDSNRSLWCSFQIACWRYASVQHCHQLSMKNENVQCMYSLHPTWFGVCEPRSVHVRLLLLQCLGGLAIALKEYTHVKQAGSTIRHSPPHKGIGVLQQHMLELQVEASLYACSKWEYGIPLISGRVRQQH